MFVTDTTGNWMKKFEGFVPASPVYDVAQALENPFVYSRNGVVDAKMPDGTAIKGLASPIRCPGETPPLNAAPALGEHTERLLKQAGLTDEQIRMLRESHVL